MIGWLSGCFARIGCPSPLKKTTETEQPRVDFPSTSQQTRVDFPSTLTREEI